MFSRQSAYIPNFQPIFLPNILPPHPPLYLPSSLLTFLCIIHLLLYVFIILPLLDIFLFSLPIYMDTYYFNYLHFTLLPTYFEVPSYLPTFLRTYIIILPKSYDNSTTSLLTFPHTYFSTNVPTDLHTRLLTCTSTHLPPYLSVIPIRFPNNLPINIQLTFLPMHVTTNVSIFLLPSYLLPYPTQLTIHAESQPFYMLFFFASTLLRIILPTRLSIHSNVPRNPSTYHYSSIF